MSFAFDNQDENGSQLKKKVGIKGSSSLLRVSLFWLRERMLVSFDLFTFQTIFSLSSTPNQPSSATNLCWRGAMCCCPVRGVPCRREVWTPGWKAHVSAHALAECPASAFWKLESDATRPLWGLCGTWVYSTIGSPWGLEHPAIGPWGSHHCRIHVVWWWWCFLEIHC